MPRRLGESDFEETTIERLRRQGYDYIHAQELFQRGERTNLSEVVLSGRLGSFLEKTYPDIPQEERKRLVQLFSNPDGVTKIQRNEAFHQIMVKGIEFSYEENGENVFHHVFPIDWNRPDNNDFLVVNQLSVQGKMSRRPDVVVYVNGLPLVVFELKNPNSENVSVHDAFTQIRNYTDDISRLFNFNAFTVISDNVETMHGMPFADFDYFASWKSIDGKTVDNNVANTMKTLIEGLFPKDKLLNYIRNFIVFLHEGSKVNKIGAKYHQYFGVQFAVQESVRAIQPDGDRRIGTIYHTQGSGKSISMLFFAAILSKNQAMENPTVVIQVDRNDLDQQLYDTFVSGQSLIGLVHHAGSADELRELLKSESGQIIFSTIEKFRVKEDEAKHPVLSARRNIVVIADEAHRTQYSATGFAGQLKKALPNASHIGFTGTPIALVDRNTEEVFGHIIHRYDMAQAVQDKATLPIYYESRLIPLDLSKEDIDDDYNEILSGVGKSEDEKEEYKRKWAALEKVVGTPKRLRLLAKDFLAHFEMSANPFQKGMIVCMSRRIAVDLYKIMREQPDCPPVEVIMTGSVSKDDKEWREKQPGSDYSHIKTKDEQEEVKAKLRNPEDPLKFVIVVDMWLTGMDAKPLSFLYVDKPMKGHNLMQAIARVNRVFPGKEGGTIVDYIGIATQLKEATAQYTKSGGKGSPTFDMDTAIALFLEHLERVRGFIPEHISIKDWRTKPKIEREDLIADLVNALLGESQEQYVEEATKLEKSYQLVKHRPEVIDYADKIMLYLILKSQIRKHIGGPSRKGSQANKTLEERLSQLVDDSLQAQETVDIYKVAGIEKPDISILDDHFLSDLSKKNDHLDLRIKLLEQLLDDQIKVHFRENSPNHKSLKELLEKTLEQYKNRVIQAADVIRVMIKMRKDMKDEMQKRKDLGLSDEEIEFYKAITAMEEQAFSNEFLADLIHKVVKEMKKKMEVDWTSPHRQDVHAKVKIAVKQVLMKQKVKKEQLQFLTNAFVDQAAKQYKDWPMDA